MLETLVENAQDLSKKESILLYLLQFAKGRQNAKNQYDIAKHIDFPLYPTRELIRELRLEVKLICSDPHYPAGYYIPGPDDKEEASHYIDRLRGQALEIMRLLKPQIQAFNEQYGENVQLELELE
jgi:hypothetical protein